MLSYGKSCDIHYVSVQCVTTRTHAGGEMVGNQIMCWIYWAVQQTRIHFYNNPGTFNIPTISLKLSYNWCHIDANSDEIFWMFVSVIYSVYIHDGISFELTQPIHLLSITLWKDDSEKRAIYRDIKWHVIHKNEKYTFCIVKFHELCLLV